MRFKNANIENVALLIIATYVLYLGFSGQLNLYIHPRYIVFTVVMALACLVIMLSSNSAHRSHKLNHASLIPLVIVVAVGVFLPARALTSATFSQRSTDAGSIVTTSGSQSLDSLFAGSSRGLKLADWNRVLAANDDPSYYANRTAIISGFVYDAGYGNDIVFVSRFVLTCCAVDAQPVGVPVEIESWSNEYEEDEWIEVEGTFRQRQTINGEKMVLVPESVVRIEVPENPYAN